MEKFDINSIEIDPVLLIIGKRATGKTILVGHIITKIIKNISKVTTICATTRTGNDNIYYGKHPNVETCLDYDTEYDKLTSIIKKEKEKYDNCIDTRSCIIIDGCVGGHGGLDKFKDLIMNGRHWKTTVIITTQYLSISPVLRQNFDYIFCFRENNISNLKRVYDFVKYKGNFEEFKEMYDIYTQDYSCIVYVMKSEKFYYYKVEL